MTRDVSVAGGSIWSRRWALDDVMFRRMLAARWTPSNTRNLRGGWSACAMTVHERLQARGLDKRGHRFDPDEFNPSCPWVAT